MNEVIQCLMNHKSIRKFKQKNVESSILEMIIIAGTRAATAGNLQHSSIVVVDDKEKLSELGVPNVPLAIVMLGDNFRLKKWFDLNNADDAVINSARNLFMSIWDAEIVLQSIVVAAESMGLGTYYFGDILSLDIKKLFNAPEYTFPAGMVCIGYPDENPELSDRLPIEAVVHYNKYKIPENDEVQKWYSEKEHYFQTRNSRERLESLKSKDIYNLAQGYKNSKFTPEFQEWRSKGIMQNIKNARYTLE